MSAGKGTGPDKGVDWKKQREGWDRIYGKKKWKMYYNASDDEHAPDWRDDGIIIEARDRNEARKKGWKHPGMKGYEIDIIELDEKKG